MLSKHSAEPCAAACVWHWSITDTPAVITALMEKKKDRPTFRLKASDDGNWCLVLVGALHLLAHPSFHLSCTQGSSGEGSCTQTSSWQGLQDVPCEQMNGLYSAPLCPACSQRADRKREPHLRKLLYVSWAINRKM